MRRGVILKHALRFPVFFFCLFPFHQLQKLIIFNFLLVKGTSRLSLALPRSVYYCSLRSVSQLIKVARASVRSIVPLLASLG